MVRTRIGMPIGNYVLQQAYKSGHKAIRFRSYEVGRLEGSGYLKTSVDSVDASKSMTYDYIFDRAQLYFRRSETRNVKLSVWDGNYRYEIWSDGSDNSKSVIVEADTFWVVPSGQYIRLEASGNAASGYMHYGVYLEEL